MNDSVLFHLGIALALGLLIGTERGWQKREAEEGNRLAGVRTFGLVGLLGGLWGILAQQLGDLSLGLGFAAFAALAIAAHLQAVRLRHDIGLTTVTAMLVTFALGALAARGYLAVAAAGGVVTAALLSLKPVLHAWLRRLEAADWYAALKLLLISVVILPALPDRGYGPWQALNPYEIWWMVVLIAAISFAGYVAMKVAGTGRGLMLTGLFGGMASSTAVTLELSRLGRRHDVHRLLAAGVLVAAGTMFPRILIEVAVVNTALLAPLAAPMLTMTAVSYAAAAWLWYRRDTETTVSDVPVSNPSRLTAAVGFGLVLALVMLLASGLRAWLGDAGVYALAAASGIADVDAITLSLARLAHEDLANGVAAQGIVLAAVVNTLVKGTMVLVIAGPRMGWRVLGPSLLIVLGAAGALIEL